MKKMIVAEKIVKSFGTVQALNQISFQVEEGEIFGFLGPSGSGKTTMINILTGQLAADEGYSEIGGVLSQQLTYDDLERIGMVSDQSGYFEKMTLGANIELYARIYGVDKKRVDILLEQVGLVEHKKVPAEKLSTGMKQRMLLARALINHPRVLFLDEPTSGLDPTTSKRIHKLLLELKKSGVTIFLTTHDMNEAALLCDQLALLNKGRLVEQGKPRNIIQKYNQDKSVKLVYDDFSEVIVSFHSLASEDLTSVVAIHSCEPDLADIFIKLTGEKLDV